MGFHAFLWHLPNPGMELASLKSPALAGRFFTTSATWEALSPIPRTILKGTVYDSSIAHLCPVPGFSKISYLPRKEDSLEIPSESQILGRGPSGQSSTKALVNRPSSEEGGLVKAQVSRMMVI